MITPIYYTIKPIVPRPLTLAARRMWARHRRKAFRDLWPIDPQAGVTPPNWPGWPQGKRFAFVLTHDVEGKRGLARVPHVAELERNLGFRSSFNFVPAGEYRVEPGMIRQLQSDGFEVGVHGWEHDGKLYRYKREFSRKAAHIRKTLQAWNASGFRSPLMQHRLGWLHELKCDYDASTFDTDPFEPQADGVATIFPFWVPDAAGGGYVELPYTLVQDLTLFKLLAEDTIDIWKKKLKWIAERGGMALVNTHPDYMTMEGKPGRDEYPVARYQELLEHVREDYGDECWLARPKDVSEYYRESIPPASRNTRRKICMVAYTKYQSDNRVRRYAEALARRGDLVDIIALKQAQSVTSEPSAPKVNLYEIQKRDFSETGVPAYTGKLLAFFARASVLLTKLHARKKYDVIHIHNMPDFLVFTAAYPRVAGCRLILDIHDIVPELFLNKFKSRLGTLYAAILRCVEKCSTAFVQHVIISNHLWKEKLLRRSVTEENCSVLVNHVDPALFFPRRRLRDNGKYVVIFPGTFQWHQGLDIAIDAFALFKNEVPHGEFHLYGGGNATLEASLRDQVARLGLNESVRFYGMTTLDRIADVICDADLGVVPKRADSFGNEAYSTKIMEFMSQGVPVVASRTKIELFYFEEGIVHFFQSGDSAAMAQAMLDVYNDHELRNSLIRRGYEYVACNSWEMKKQEYLALVDRLSTEAFDDNDFVLERNRQTIA